MSSTSKKIELETLKDILITNIVFSDPTSCTIAVGRDKDVKNGLEVTVIGNFTCNKGEVYDFEGTWTTNHKYGKQFKIVYPHKKSDVRKEDLREYLTTFKGVGASRAKKIVDTFGDNTLEVIKKDYEELVRIGIPKDTAYAMHDSMVRNTTMNELVQMLKPHGVSLKKINSIFDKYKDESIDKVKHNPYLLNREIGIDFSVSDAIARSLQLPFDCDYRIQSAVKHVLYEATQSGHTYLNVTDLAHNVYKTLTSKNQMKVDENRIYQVIVYMQMHTKELVIENDRAVYLPYIYQAERYVAMRIKKIRDAKSSISINIDPEDAIKEIEKELGVQYASKQQDAIKSALTDKVVIITGGPGTGKTTTLNGMIHIILKNDPLTKIELAAPTGKAAKRMEETTKKMAKTIHRQLQFRPFGDELTCGKNEDDPIDCDVLILDESSMIDISLFEKLLRALPRECKIFIVGDVDQCATRF